MSIDSDFRNAVEALLNERWDDLSALINETDLRYYRDADGEPLIHVAAIYRNRKALEMLLDAGFSPDLVWDDRTPLQVVCDEESVDCAELLLKGGADVNWKDSNGFTPLISAVISCNYALVSLLLSFGANPNGKTKDGFMAIDFAGDCKDKIVGNEIWKAMQNIKN